MSPLQADNARLIKERDEARVNATYETDRKNEWIERAYQYEARAEAAEKERDVSDEARVRMRRERDEAREWSQVWHRTVETILTIMGLSPALGADEAAVVVRSRLQSLQAENATLKEALEKRGDALAHFAHPEFGVVPMQDAEIVSLREELSKIVSIADKDPFTSIGFVIEHVATKARALALTQENKEQGR